MKTMAIFLLLFSLPLSANDCPWVTVDIPTTALSFNAQGPISTESQKPAYVKLMGDVYKSPALMVISALLKTGIDLRDEHMVKKIGPAVSISAVNLQASTGQGSAKVTINGVTQQIPLTFQTSNNVVLIAAKLSLASYKIQGINYLGVGVQDGVSISACVPIR